MLTVSGKSAFTKESAYWWLVENLSVMNLYGTYFVDSNVWLCLRVLRHILYDHYILLFKHLSNHVHFITNGYNALYRPTQTTQMQRVSLSPPLGHDTLVSIHTCVTHLTKRNSWEYKYEDWRGKDVDGVPYSAHEETNQENWTSTKNITQSPLKIKPSRQNNKTKKVPHAHKYSTSNSGFL